MSASLANDNRARPNVFGSSTTDMLSSEGTNSKFQSLRSTLLESNRHNVANDDGAGAGRLERDFVARKLIERAAPDLLLRPRRVDNDGRRRGASPAAIDELTRDRRRAAETHQHDERDAVRPQRADRRLECVFFMSRDDEKRGGHAAVRDG